MKTTTLTLQAWNFNQLEDCLIDCTMDKNPRQMFFLVLTKNATLKMLVTAYLSPRIEHQECNSNSIIVALKNTVPIESKDFLFWEDFQCV